MADADALGISMNESPDWAQVGSQEQLRAVKALHLYLCSVRIPWLK